MKRNSGRSTTVALAFVAGLALMPGCRQTEGVRAQAPAGAPADAPVPVEPAGPPLPEVQAVVQEILDSGRHPALNWPDATGVLADLKPLYAAEPDGLFWFAGDAPHPALTGALQAITAADTLGLVPTDYDAPVLVGKWEATRAGAEATPSGRARFDVALTVSAMRLLQSAHLGPRRPAPDRLRL